MAKKPTYNFLLVINTNLPPILHRFQVMDDYVSFASDRGVAAVAFTLTPSIPYDYRYK